MPRGKATDPEEEPELPDNFPEILYEAVKDWRVSRLIMSGELQSRDFLFSASFLSEKCEFTGVNQNGGEIDTTTNAGG